MRILVIVIFLLTPISYVFSQNIKSNDIFTDYNSLGDKYKENGKNKEALCCYQTSLIYDRDNYATNIKIAITNHALGYYANMIYYFKRGIEISDSYTAYGNLGSIYAEMGYDKEAFKYLQEALDEAPNYSYALNNMGALLMRYDKYDEARVYFRKANEENKEMPDPLHNMGNSYFENNQLDSALFYFNKTIKINPKFAKSLIAKAITLKKMNADGKEYEDICNKLLEHCNKIIKEQPDNYEARKMRADIYATLDNTAESNKDLTIKLLNLNKLIELYPTAYTFIESRGNTFKSLGNTDAAIKDYEKVLEINPEYKYIERKLVELKQK